MTGGKNMASVQEYCEMLSTSQLEALLLEEYNNRGALPMDVILLICQILSQRNPALPAIEDSLRELCKKYITNAE